jgi:hypothetical protein
VGGEIEVPPDPYTQHQQQQQQQSVAMQQSDSSGGLSPSESLYQGLDKLGRFLAFDRQVLRWVSLFISCVTFSKHLLSISV